MYACCYDDVCIYMHLKQSYNHLYKFWYIVMCVFTYAFCFKVMYDFICMLIYNYVFVYVFDSFAIKTPYMCWP